MLMINNTSIYLQGDFTFERIGFENKITFCMKKMGDDMANKKIEKLMVKNNLMLFIYFSKGLY